MAFRGARKKWKILCRVFVLWEREVERFRTARFSASSKLSLLLLTREKKCMFSCAYKSDLSISGSVFPHSIGSPILYTVFLRPLVASVVNLLWWLSQKPWCIKSHFEWWCLGRKQMGALKPSMGNGGSWHQLGWSMILSVSKGGYKKGQTL